MKILVATSNPHKLDEIRAVFQVLRRGGGAGERGPNIDLWNLADLDSKIAEPEEDQPTFEGNAFLKARYYAKETGHICLADDSGLEVDALSGEPGVRSARYAGVSGPRSIVDPANNQLLVERMKDVPFGERTARFVCAMALVMPNRSAPLAIVRGAVEGEIIPPDEEPRGRNGFGYDPLFSIPDLGKTAAELTQAEKNLVSHRGKAAKRMWEEIKRKLMAGEKE